VEPKQDVDKCTACQMKHEECAGLKTCPKTDISLYVCEMFGIKPVKPK
jgi:hypothetical protein